MKCGEKPVRTSHGQCMTCEKYDPFDNTSSLFDDCYVSGVMVKMADDTYVKV